jgi:menaquinone-dependent protoporphyrinogen IX oxidase
MKGIIIYKGKYGATRKYAEWLGMALNMPVTAPKKDSTDLSAFDPIILGSSVYIGELQLKEWLKENVSVIRNKNIFLFVVCGTPVNEKKKLEAYIQSSVPVEIRGQCHIYFLPGRMLYKKLSLTDKFMLRVGAMLTPDATTRKAMLTDYDAVKSENLEPLIRDIRKIAGKTGILQHT